jgi:hypothetical protein
MADLDIQRLTWGMPSENGALDTPYSQVREEVVATAGPEAHREISNAAEAAAYMQQVALKLRNWRESMEKPSIPVRRESADQSPKDRA